MPNKIELARECLEDNEFKEALRFIIETEGAG